MAGSSKHIYASATSDIPLLKDAGLLSMVWMESRSCLSLFNYIIGVDQQNCHSGSLSCLPYCSNLFIYQMDRIHATFIMYLCNALMPCTLSCKNGMYFDEGVYSMSLRFWCVFKLILGTAHVVFVELWMHRRIFSPRCS